MAIISVATTKGGSGKTTLALCLATHWSRAGRAVAAIDTDPNRNLAAWVAAMPETPWPCQAVAEDDLVDAALAAEASADIVLIDVAGALAKAMVYAISISSYVLIPAKTSGVDILEAGRTKQHVDSAIKQIRRHNPTADIPCGVVLTQVQRRTAVTSRSRIQLEALGLRVLGADMPLRTIYQQASLRSLPLTDEAVREDVAAVAREIEETLKW